MPVFTAKRGNKFRIFHKINGRTVLYKEGTKAFDGGGYNTEKAAKKFAKRINKSQ